MRLRLIYFPLNLICITKSTSAVLIGSKPC